MEGLKCLRRTLLLSVTVYRNFVFLARDPPTRNFSVDVYASVSVFKRTEFIGSLVTMFYSFSSRKAYYISLIDFFKTPTLLGRVF